MKQLLIILFILIVILCCGCAEYQHRPISTQTRRDFAWNEYFTDKFRPSGKTYNNWWIRDVDKEKVNK